MTRSSIVLSVSSLLLTLPGLVSPAWSKTSLELGREAFAEGRLEQAVEHYQRALSQKPTFTAYINLGHCHARLKQWTEAIQAYRAGIDMESQSAGAEIWESLGQAYYAATQYDLAIEAFLQARSLGIGDKTDVWIAQCLIEQGYWDQAQSVLTDNLLKHPRNTQALELLAHVFMQQGRPVDAIRTYKRTLRSSPRQSAIRLALAHAQLANHQPNEAMDTLEFAQRTDPNAGLDVQRLLSDLYLIQKMPLEAATGYTLIRAGSNAFDPNDAYRLGVALFQADEFHWAQRILLEVQQADPNHSDSILYLARIALQQDQSDQAQVLYGKYLKYRPNDPQALLESANLHIQQNNPMEAARLLARVLQLGDKRAQVYITYITALMSSQDLNLTRKALERALAQHPLNDHLHRLLEEYIKRKVSGSD